MTAPQPSKRANVAPFMAMDALADARALEREGRRIIHMELGEPGAPAPRLVRAAASEALAARRIGYGEALGDITPPFPEGDSDRRHHPDELDHTYRNRH